MTNTILRSTRCRVAATAAALLLLGGCAPLARGARPTPARGLAAAVDSIVGAVPLDRTHWGIAVYDPAADRMVYELNARKHFVPASNTKLVATTTAMALLGPDYRYRTELFTLGPGARPGDSRGLLLVARGDPTWSATFQPANFAVPEALADSVRAAGVRRIDGDLVIDASAFEPMLVNPSWEIGDLVADYGAATGAIAVGEGTFGLVLLPGLGVGLPAAARFLGPEPVEPVVTALTTSPSGTRRDFDAERWAGNDTLYLRGSIPLAAAPDTVNLASANPETYAARALQSALEQRGIRVTGAVRIVHDTLEARRLRAQPTLGRIASWTSPPIAEIVAAILKPSDNWMAEQVLKTLGLEKAGRGAWSTGLRVERRFLIDSVKIDSLAFSLRDGSGLSAQNLLTPETIVRLLAYGSRAPWGATYRTALAQPGERGTLSRRLETLRGRLFAKTGSIANVNSLSGILRTDAGHDLVFSIQSNGSGVPSGLIRAAIDRIVLQLARSGATQ
ncbi:MAG TPA: D-alanyl-D-alanine carboxypeptidase/D-alanyl-D-alanine-endopeptidase [Longimicrobiales bacterium]|nr:D-alanyl-D-alanine carboxypeptidase/D-alanyl-D-alanine-endopeptidase [Longimicrobiales bacterium]